MSSTGGADVARLMTPSLSRRAIRPSGSPATAGSILATGMPRSTTTTVSPARTSLRSALSRFFVSVSVATLIELFWLFQSRLSSSFPEDHGR